jgi:hypothetical protein
MPVIVSGAQTGVDRAALDVAHEAGARCGGWCPAGRRAEDGVIPESYPVTELASGGYIERTEANVRDSDATVILHFGALRGGTQATREFCDALGKPCLLIDGDEIAADAAAARIAEFVQRVDARRLKFAGPRASQAPRAYAYALDTVSRVLQPCRPAGD